MKHIFLKILSFLFFGPTFNIVEAGEQEVTEQLKEILPSLVNAKDLLGKIPGIIEDKEEVTKATQELKEKLEGIEGNLTKLDQKVLTIGNKKILEVNSSGLTHEQKVDFAKFIIACHNNFKAPSQDNVNEINAINEKYGIKAALNIGTGSQGGYLVADPFRDTIWREAEQASVALAECQQVPLGKANKLPILSLASGVTTSWTDEAAAISESEPTFGKSEPSTNKLAAYAKMSNEVLEDSEIGLTDFLITIFGEAMGKAIDAEAFKGTGSPFTGILETSGVNTVTMSTGDTAFADIDADYLSDMLSLIKSGSLMNAKYYLHRTIFNYIRKLKDSNGQYIYQPATSDVPATLWGYPFRLVEQMPTSSDSGVSTEFVVFGNMKNYLIGTKGDMQILFTNILGALNDQSHLIVRRRLAMAAALPGAFSVLKTAAT